MVALGSMLASRAEKYPVPAPKSATTASGLSASAWSTACGFCHASRSGSSNTCDHFSASPKLWRWLSGDCAAAAPESATAATITTALFHILSHPPWARLAQLLLLLGREHALHLRPHVESRGEHERIVLIVSQFLLRFAS